MQNAKENISSTLYSLGILLMWGYLIAWGYSISTDAFIACIFFGWFISIVWPLIITSMGMWWMYFA